jgi:hypothetical protein
MSRIVIVTLIHRRHKPIGLMKPVIHFSIYSKAEENQRILSPDGQSQDLRDALWLLANSPPSEQPWDIPCHFNIMWAVSSLITWSTSHSKQYICNWIIYQVVWLRELLLVFASKTKTGFGSKNFTYFEMGLLYPTSHWNLAHMWGDEECKQK